MKQKTVILFAVVILMSNANAQKLNIEPGIIAGTSYYMGDVNHTRQFYAPRFSGGIVLKQTFSAFYEIRLNLLRSSVSGNDADFPNKYQQQRGHTFDNDLYEISAQCEINFLNFNTRIRKSAAPYITAGIGVVAGNNFKTIAPIIPMGIGYKYSPTKRMTISAEWCFRNTFTDKIDMLEQTGNTKQLTNIKNYDWYSIAGIIITYNFQSDKKWCPAYRKSKKN